MKKALALALLSLLFSPGAQAESRSVHCARAQTEPCGVNSLFASKVFRESIAPVLGKDFDPAKLNVRVHDAGWAEFGVDSTREAYAKKNRLPKSYFKVNQWYFIEVSAEEPALRKSFKVDLKFHSYPAGSGAAEWKTATVEEARVEELEANRVEQEIQKQLAVELPKNGFVCEWEDLGLVVRASPTKEEQLSFGQVVDESLKGAKDGKTSVDLGAYKLEIKDFGGKKATILPPKSEEVEMKLSYQLTFMPGTPDHFESDFAGNAKDFSFHRVISGFNNTEAFCSEIKLGHGTDAKKVAICNASPEDRVEVKLRDRAWEKPRCSYFEENKIGN